MHYEWTKETPTEEGFYWYSPDGDYVVTADLIDQGDGPELDDSWATHRFPSELDGWWWGPVDPPPAPNAQRLKEVK